MKHARLLVGLGALVLFGAACSFKSNVTTGNTNVTVTTNVNTSLSTNSSTTGSFTTTPSVTAQTVTITSSGVSPKTVTIKAGDTVKFVNNDSTAHQISSNPHPTHTGYPGFDSLSGVANGSSYSFTFTRTGSFGYHDHDDSTNSKFQGTVIVQ
ncbi:MAG: cupredoxin domain-containing protein [Candidatus Kerfeldbacteria bacterium]|nr:cupredoxin domain-containing protein [Candidatus Kerfeldbacteria bacterium]